jgi:zinc/manganese transport system substrate-binding protein
VDASGRIEILEIPAAASRAQGDVHPLGNPHYWLDPANGVAIARAIRDGLARVAPADRAAFDARLAAFERRAADETARLKTRARALGVPGMKVVTYHRSWSYWARAFGCEVVDFVEPRPGIPPSPGHVAALAARLKRGDVRLILMEDFFDPRLPRKISADTGVPLAILPTSVAGVPAIRTYFDLFDHQFAAIEQALGGAKP